jgi:hypothetical protein
MTTTYQFLGSISPRILNNHERLSRFQQKSFAQTNSQDKKNPAEAGFFGRKKCYR